ncbi:ATPase [Romboutsia weinsteinii]|uniref:ATPase n=1 Tax=Romboutsia weinsteinii TaxID=2020949 RepID=A0A371IZS8_9FIRM|nr:ATPase [Romboutsia weinsteinii]
MLDSKYQTSNEFYEFLRQQLNKFVEVKTYFTSITLYGKIVEVTPLSITISSIYDSEKKSHSDECFNYYLPLNSIISVRVI